MGKIARRAYSYFMLDPIFLYKFCSTFAQLYMGSLIATNGSSEEPFLRLTTIAHMGAWVGALRGVDALIDPAFRKFFGNILSEEDKKAIASEMEPPTVGT